MNLIYSTVITLLYCAVTVHEQVRAVQALIIALRACNVGTGKLQHCRPDRGPRTRQTLLAPVGKAADEREP